jgi:acetylornithine deacetylase
MLLPEPEEMIRSLVAVPSVSSTDPRLDRSNRGVVDLVAEWAEGIGFDVAVREVPGRPGKHNVIARLGGGGPAGLLLSGHTDTVPFDEGAWTHDPFDATVVGDRIYGLGTADMKSFLALALEAASIYGASDLREPLVIVGTADEESTMSGARALVDEGEPLSKRAVIGEPTGLVPIRSHKGILMQTVRLLGRSGHSSNPALGVSALDGMRHVLDRVVAFRERLVREHRDASFEVAHPTLNLGRIEGGDAANRICARCELSLDLRVLPGMDAEATRAALHREIEEAVRESGLPLGLELDAPFEGIPPFSTAKTAELVRAAEELSHASSETVAFGTEAPFLTALGMETIVLGPGSIDVAHRPDEHLPLDHLPKTVALLRALVDRFCRAS